MPGGKAPHHVSPYACQTISGGINARIDMRPDQNAFTVPLTIISGPQRPSTSTRPQHRLQALSLPQLRYICGQAVCTWRQGMPFRKPKQTRTSVAHLLYCNVHCVVDLRHSQSSICLLPRSSIHSEDNPHGWEQSSSQPDWLEQRERSITPIQM